MSKTTTPDVQASNPTTGDQDYDVIVIGAGPNGLYQLYRLRERGLRVLVVEAGSGVGGVWYWNRYPGARLDSESYSYGYFFSRELLKEWQWSEEFVGQPELERYYNYVADRFDLRSHIQFNTRIKAGRFTDGAGWKLQTEAGEELSARFVVSAVGQLSAPQFPTIPGREDFEGEVYHTGLWPKQPVDFDGQRVAVLGTGSSGIQIVSTVAQSVEAMIVFQRSANWATPLNNRPIDSDRAREIRDGADDIYRTCMATPTGFIHFPRPETAMEVSEEEREAHWEKLWNMPGMVMHVANFQNIASDRQSNEALNAFIARKIRERVQDPRVAAMLIPDDHGFGMKRPPLESNYYEAYNQANVELVNARQEPIVRFTRTGLETSRRTLDFDIIVLATGFDAVTGSIARINLQGTHGDSIAEWWMQGPRTYLGLMSAGFPNFFMVGGAQSAGGNNQRTADFQVEWVAECIGYLQANGIRRIETDVAHENFWIQHVNETISGSLVLEGSSWYVGGNTPGKGRAYLLYAGGFPELRQRYRDVAQAGYEEFSLA